MIERDIDSTKQTVREMDRSFWAITKDAMMALPEGTEIAPLRLLPGSMARLNSIYYGYYGLDTEDRDICDELRKQSLHYRQKDQLQAAGLDHIQMAQWMNSQLRLYAKKSMVATMAFIVRSALELMALDSNELRICNIASGFGKIPGAIIGELRVDDAGEEILEKTRFTLVDDSHVKMQNALNLMRVGHGISCRSLVITPEETYERELGGPFDIIVTMEHLSRISFLEDYLKRIKNALKPNGLLIIADFHAPIFRKPAGLYHVMRHLGADQKTLSRLYEYLGLKPENEDPFRDPTLGAYEKKAMLHHMEHLTEVSIQLAKGRGAPKRFFLEALTSMNERSTQLENVGLVTNRDKIREAFGGKGFPYRNQNRVLRKSNYATVMIAMRRSR